MKEIKKFTDNGHDSDDLSDGGVIKHKTVIKSRYCLYLWSANLLIVRCLNFLVCVSHPLPK